MVFENLGVEAQNFLVSTHQYTLKWFVFLSFLGLSIYYVFVMWPEQKPTTYYTHAIMRLFFYGLSVAYMLASPITLIGMSPHYNFYDYYMLTMKVYGIFMSIGTLLVVFDIFRYGPMVLLSFSGLDLKDPNVNKIVRDIKKNKHFVKMNKNGGLFGR